MHSDGSEQLSLPFAQAEASQDERRNLLGLALMRVRCDCELSVFVQWVFNVTAGGTHGELRKSAEELSNAPWGLCCSPDKARSTARKAFRLGLVGIQEHRDARGSQGANGYVIDWNGVRGLLDLSDKRALSHHPKPGTLAAQGPVLRTQGPMLGAHHTKETTSFLLPSCKQESVPDRKAAPRTEFEYFDFADIPELAAAAGQRIAPLPVNSLKYGVWENFDGKKLRTPLALVEWFRRQLSLPKPVCGESEANLLLVLASAAYALAMKQADVKKNRVAVFCSTVSRGKWQRVLFYVPASRKQLDELLQTNPDLLHGEWRSVDMNNPPQCKTENCAPKPSPSSAKVIPMTTAERRRELLSRWAAERERMKSL
jgi:hypothetical protein